jgi:hypothetical protein
MGVAVVLALAGTGAGAQTAESRSTVDHAVWDAILKKAIRGQLVDYALIAREHDADLTAYLDTLGRVEVGTLGREEQLAYYINLYNASMVRAVLDKRRGDATWRPDADGFAVFKMPTVRTATGVITLDHLEHQIVRPKFGEPRVHVALVCGAVSCPPLVAHAYTGENLERVLAENMKRFLTDGTRNQFDSGKKVAKLSRLFDWFAADFGGAGAVAEYVRTHGGPDLRGYRVEFVEYDWALNEVK